MAATTTVTKPVAAESKRPPRPHPVRRLLRRLVLAMVLLGGLAYFLPAIIAHTGLRNALLPLAQPGLPDGSAIGSASLGWLSPISLRDVTIPDLRGGALLAIPSIESERSLWELIRDPSRIGRIRIARPVVRVVVRPDGSNLTDVLNRLRFGESTGPSPSIQVQIEDGVVTVGDEAQLLLSRLEQVSCEFDGAAAEAAKSLTLAAQVTAPAAGGSLTGSLKWTGATTPEAVVGPGLVRVSLERIPLDGLRPVLAPLLDGAALAGDLTATLDAGWEELSNQGGEAEIVLTLAELNAAWQPPGEPPQTIATKDARLQLHGEYDGGQDRLTLSESSLKSEWVNCTVQGTIRELRGRCMCDVAGDVVYALAPLLDQLDPEVRRNVQVSGLETRRFALRGPLRTAEGNPDAVQESLRLETDLVWTELSAYGVQSQQARMVVGVADGRIRVTPVDVPVSGGRLATVPELILAGDHLRARSSGDVVLDNVVFSDAMCRSWMRFLSPLMANATSIDGRFSLALDQGEFAVDDLGAGGLSGTLSIHDSRVGPGPLTQQIFGPIRQIRAIAERRPEAALAREREWLTIREQNVPFVVKEGRVHHSDLILEIGNVRIHSSGSVGLDETLDLLLVVEFPEKWFEGRPILAGLRQGGIKIPVRGTFQQPQVDARPLGDFGRGIGIQATDGILRRLLDR